MTAETPSVSSPDVARRNRWLLLLLAASFIVPFLAGDLAYRLGWYQGGQTNKGRLIDPPIAFSAFAPRDGEGRALDATAFTDRRWWLVYALPADCGAACRNRLFQMRQVQRALGKESGRLRQVLVLSGPLAPATEALLRQEFPEFARIHADAASIDAAFAPAVPAASRAGELYVMDPMGWIMLAYAPEADEKRSVEKGEDVLKDLLKLLKASRIG